MPGGRGVGEFKWWIGPEDQGILNEVSERYIKESAGETALRDHYDLDGPAVHWMTSTELMNSLQISTMDHNYSARKTEVLNTIKRVFFQRGSRTFRRDGAVLKGWLLPQPKMGKVATIMTAVPVNPFDKTAKGFDFL